MRTDTTSKFISLCLIAFMIKSLQLFTVWFSSLILCIWIIYQAFYQMGHCLSCFKHQANNDYAPSHMKKDGEFHSEIHVALNI